MTWSGDRRGIVAAVVTAGGGPFATVPSEDDLGLRSFFVASSLHSSRSSQDSEARSSCADLTAEAFPDRDESFDAWLQAA
jgi:hypothetical protein